MKAPIVLAAAALTSVAFASASFAAPSTHAELRGYQACLEANQDDFAGLTTQRNYLLAKTDTGHTYYINANAWQNGQRVKVSFSCETTSTGKLVQNQGVSYNHFISARSVPVQVAGQ